MPFQIKGFQSHNFCSGCFSRKDQRQRHTRNKWTLVLLAPQDPCSVDFFTYIYRKIQPHAGRDIQSSHQSYGLYLLILQVTLLSFPQEKPGGTWHSFSSDKTWKPWRFTLGFSAAFCNSWPTYGGSKLWGARKTNEPTRPNRTNWRNKKFQASSPNPLGKVVDCFSFQQTSSFSSLRATYIQKQYVYIYIYICSNLFLCVLGSVPRSVRRCWLRCELAENCVHSRSAKGQGFFQRSFCGWIPNPKDPYPSLE